MKNRVKISLTLIVVLCLTNLLPLSSVLALKNSNMGKSEEKGVSHKFNTNKENNEWKINEISDIIENSDINQFDEKKAQKMEHTNSKEPHKGTPYEKIEVLNELMDATTFESKWDTSKTSDGSSGPQSIALPLEETGNYNFEVEWGDGTSNKITEWNQAETTHYYDSAGIYTITDHFQRRNKNK